MILLDGPMGTELAARGVATSHAVVGRAWSARALETAPDVVARIHAEYAAAGSMVHRTNTFRTQPHVLPDRWRALLDRAVAIARRAAREQGGGARVAGSMAPIEDCYRPDLSPPEAEARAGHRRVAEALAAAGVDLLVCETFPHAGEARVAASEAARTGKETWVALTAGPDASLMTPEAMERAARDCVSAGATAVLVDCTAARLTLPYVDRLARVGVAFGAYANAGDPADGLGWTRDPDGTRAAAERYADIATTWIAAGASIVGACCGTSPAHIAALRERIAGDERVSSVRGE
jgi:S-methylmethionine-dependent homocysteine/selenocysteine methylase